ncbi:hypothetical protein QTP70_020957 [Hemibagrus guttatus]|uniref:Ig-like domain-containing protein n=1 Tax=Hemibagrus guttatus TaxID=175788 RepID=A0AAE0PQD6_9TELE|nr:hypothetical protein QTP70_020957 [Hemibagrus guttatus]
MAVVVNRASTDPEFRSIRTIHLEGTFHSKLDFYTPKLLEIFGGVGGVELTQTSSVLVKPGESFSISYVFCATELIQPDSLLIKPGETLTITCKVSGASITDSSSHYGTAWIRQPAGKALEWINSIYYSGGINKKDSLKDKFSVSRDTSSNTVTLRGQNMQTEDTAVYYCARDSQ